MGQRPQAVHVVGKDHPGIDMKRGERAHPANRGRQPVDPHHQEIGAAVEQVHREEKRSSGKSIAAIIRDVRSMPALRIRRNALRCSALRLLVWLEGVRQRVLGAVEGQQATFRLKIARPRPRLPSKVARSRTIGRIMPRSPSPA
jgi:hypothetical protein